MQRGHLRARNGCAATSKRRTCAAKQCCPSAVLERSTDGKLGLFAAQDFPAASSVPAKHQRSPQRSGANGRRHPVQPWRSAHTAWPGQTLHHGQHPRERRYVGQGAATAGPWRALLPSRDGRPACPTHRRGLRCLCVQLLSAGRVERRGTEQKRRLPAASRCGRRLLPAGGSVNPRLPPPSQPAAWQVAHSGPVQ